MFKRRPGIAALAGQWTVLLAMLITLSGCIQLPWDKPADPKKVANGHADAADAAGDEEAGDEEGGDEEEGEAGEAGAAHSAHTPAAPTSLMTHFPYAELQVPAGDNVTLYGRLYDPTQKPKPPPSDDEEAAAAEESEAESEEEPEEGAAPAPLPPLPKYPLVLLLHQLNGSGRDWGELPAKLVKQGYAVVAMDARGHGQSTVKYKSWRYFETADWLKMPADVQSVLRYLGKTPACCRQVDTNRVAIVGASIGANTALIASSQRPEVVKALAMLSPGLDYKGLQTTTPAVKYQNAVFVAASQKDRTAYEAADLLYKLSLGPKAIQVYRDVGHGTAMLKAQPELEKQLIAWLVKTLPGKTPTPPPAPGASKP